MKSQKLSNLKPIISLMEMAEMLSISRSRFYQLLDLGILPQPIYCLRTKRPLYNQEMQQKCLEIKETNIGANGQYILFYSPRTKTSNNKKVRKSINPVFKEFAQIINDMGLNVSVKDIETAMHELYPTGIENIEQGIVIRDLFRKLKSN